METREWERQTNRGVLMTRLWNDPLSGTTIVASDVSQDRLAIIRIDGMHSHQCEVALQSALGRSDGVHEVEVDFLSGQASVLFDPAKVEVAELLTAITDAGYATGNVSQGGDQDAAD